MAEPTLPVRSRSGPLDDERQRPPAAPPRAVAVGPVTRDARGSHHTTLVELLGAGREDAAMAYVLELLDAGVPVDRIVLDHVCPAQVDVGRRWESNEWSVGQSHAATAVAETILGLLHGGVEPEGDRGRLAMACAHDERNALPARAVALVLRARGWETAFLDPSLPP